MARLELSPQELQIRARSLILQPPSEEVYIAGALFNPDENGPNKELADMFRAAGYTVFNPLENGIKGAEEVIEEDTLHVRIHDMDIKKIKGARIFTANLNGAQVEDGTSNEINAANESQWLRQAGIFSQGVEVLLGLYNDDRVLTRNMRRNPMPLGNLLVAPNDVFRTREAMVEYAVKHFPPKQK